MDPELEKLEEARRSLAPGWDEQRSRDALRNVQRRYRRRKVARVAGVATAAILLAIGAATMLSQQDPQLAHHASHEVSDNFIELADSSRVTPLDGRTKISIEEVGSQKVRVAMSKGVAHYEVSKRPERRFVVELEDVEIEVLGTSFDVEDSHEAVTVRVHEGKVSMRSTTSNEFHMLTSGQSATIGRPEQKTEVTKIEPEVLPQEVEEAPVDTAEVRSPSERDPVAKKKHKPKKWRQLADMKAYKEASDMLLEDPALVDEKAVGDLFAAADAMRRSGHHAQAVAYLETIADRHRDDPRAAMAAHTRGRILDRGLSRPCDAAVAFEQAREIGLAGMLQRDALAHSANNWAQCGDAAKAQERSRQYEKAYGEGPHWPQLEKYLSGEVD